MAINKGSSSIKSLFVGSKQVKQVFKGSTLVWEMSGISVSQSTGTSTSPLVVKGASSIITIAGVGAWTASSNASWLTLSSTSGNDDGTITATAASNVHTTNSRSAVVTIKQTSSGKTATVTIYQSADSKTLSSYNNPIVTFNNYSNVAVSGGSVNASVSWTQTANYVWASDGASAGSAQVASNTNGLDDGYTTYSGSATGLTLDTASGKITWAHNYSTSTRSATITASVNINSKTGTKTASTTQSANSKKASYGDVTAGTITNATIPASGTTTNYTATAAEGSQVVTYTWASDNSDAGSETIKITPNVASISATANSKGTTISNQTTVISQAVTWKSLDDDNQKSAPGTMYIYQAENYVTAVDAVVDSSSYNHFYYTSSAAAGGGAITPTFNGAVTCTFSSGSSKKYTSNNLTGVTLSWDRNYSGTATGATLNTSTGAVTWTNNQSFSERSMAVSSTMTVTCTHSSTYSKGGTKSDTLTQESTCSQKEGSYNYASWTGGGIAFSKSSLSAAADSATVTIQPWSRTYGWNGATSGAGTQYYQGTVTVSENGDYTSLSATSYTASSSAKTLTLNKSTCGANAINNDVTVTVSASGATNTSNTIKHSKNVAGGGGNAITKYGTPSVSIGSGITAAGGSATIYVSVSNTRTYYYNSGSISSTESEPGSYTNLTINKQFINASNSATSGTAITRFSLSGTTLNHSSMTTNVGYDCVRVSAANAGSTSTIGYSEYSRTANTRTLSSVYIVPYQPDSSWIVTVSNGNWNTCPASGGYVKCHGYANYTHASGSPLNDQYITSDAGLSWSTGYNSWITNHSNGGYYIANRGTETGNARSSTATWTYGGKTSAGKTLTQQANVPNAYYDNPVITRYTYGTFAAAGSTLTPSVTYYQTPRYTSGSAGSNITSGGTLGYQMGSYTGFTLNNSSTGSITAARNPNTTTRSATPQVRVTLNGKTSSWYNCTSCTQAANGSIAFTFESGEPNAPLAAYADNSTIYITATGGWTITSYPSWITFSTTSGSGNAQPTFSCTANARNTNQRTGTITITSTIDSSTAVSKTIYQIADHVISENYTSVSNCAIGEPHFEGNFTASGGSAIMDALATWNAVGTRTWASGATDPLSGARSGDAILSFNTNSPSGAFSISGQTVTHRNMTNNATTDKVQIKYTHPQNSSVTKLGETYSISNSLISTTRTMSANTANVAAAGGDITLTCNSTNTYTAGTYAASTALTATVGTLTKTSISGTGQTVTLTIPANPLTSQREIYVRMDGTNKVTITQPGSAPVDVTVTYQDDGFGYDELSIEANGVNINGGENITYKANDVIELWFYNSGSYTHDCYVTNSDGNEYEYTTVESSNEGCIMIDTNDIGPGNFFHDGYICFRSSQVW